MSVLEEVSPQEAWELISGERLARIAWNGRDGITVVPVNVVVVDDTVWVRTGWHSALAASIDESEAAVLLDSIDQETHLGWSVQLRGRCEIVYDASVVPSQVRDLASWAAGPKPLWIRIASARPTGVVASFER